MQLGFDWGGLVSSVGQGVLTYTTQRNATKLALAKMQVESQQAIANQRAMLQMQQPPAYYSPAPAQAADYYRPQYPPTAMPPGYYPPHAIPPSLPQPQFAERAPTSALPTWLLPAGLVGGVGLMLFATRGRR